MWSLFLIFMVLKSNTINFFDDKTNVKLIFKCGNSDDMDITLENYTYGEMKTIMPHVNSYLEGRFRMRKEFETAVKDPIQLIPEIIIHDINSECFIFTFGEFNERKMVLENIVLEKDEEIEFEEDKVKFKNGLTLWEVFACVNFFESKYKDWKLIFQNLLFTMVLTYEAGKCDIVNKIISLKEKRVWLEIYLDMFGCRIESETGYLVENREGCSTLIPKYFEKTIEIPHRDLPYLKHSEAFKVLYMLYEIRLLEVLDLQDCRLDNEMFEKISRITLKKLKIFLSKEQGKFLLMEKISWDNVEETLDIYAKNLLEEDFEYFSLGKYKTKGKSEVKLTIYADDRHKLPSRLSLSNCSFEYLKLHVFYSVKTKEELKKILNFGLTTELLLDMDLDNDTSPDVFMDCACNNALRKLKIRNRNIFF
jgi:hypothetical protein